MGATLDPCQHFHSNDSDQESRPEESSCVGVELLLDDRSVAASALEELK